jgi:dienelactone hydrolase
MDDQADRKITFTRPDGQEAPGHVFSTTSASAPAIVLIQEWWGVNDQIRGVARRLADAGYGVLIPDLYRGKLAGDGDEANHLMSNLNFPDAVHQDLVGAIGHARRYHSKVGVMGFCMGGALTIAAAAHIPELSAAVCFYGVPPAAIADPPDDPRPAPVPLRRAGHLVHPRRRRRPRAAAPRGRRRPRAPPLRRPARLLQRAPPRGPRPRRRRPRLAAHPRLPRPSPRVINNDHKKASADRHRRSRWS